MTAVTPPAATDADVRLSQRYARLEAYEQRTSLAMVVLALVYLGVFTIQVLVVSLSAAQEDVLLWLSNGIWLVFVVDLVIRVTLAPRRVDYIVHHPIDVIAVVITATPSASAKLAASGFNQVSLPRNSAYQRSENSCGGKRR